MVVVWSREQHPSPIVPTSSHNFLCGGSPCNPQSVSRWKDSCPTQMYLTTLTGRACIVRAQKRSYSLSLLLVGSWSNNKIRAIQISNCRSMSMTLIGLSPTSLLGFLILDTPLCADGCKEWEMSIYLRVVNMFDKVRGPTFLLHRH